MFASAGAAGAAGLGAAQAVNKRTNTTTTESLLNQWCCFIGFLSHKNAVDLFGDDRLGKIAGDIGHKTDLLNRAAALAPQVKVVASNVISVAFVANGLAGLK